MAHQPSRPPPCHPQGTGDDPFGLENLLDEPERMNDKGRRLEGIHPDKFKGDQSKTQRFLNQFNRFMLMNHKADITKDPISKCIYFMSLLNGEKVNSWVDMAFNWLEEIEADPSLIELPLPLIAVFTLYLLKRKRNNKNSSLKTSTSNKFDALNLPMPVASS